MSDKPTPANANLGENAEASNKNKYSQKRLEKIPKESSQHSPKTSHLHTRLPLILCRRLFVLAYGPEKNSTTPKPPTRNPALVVLPFRHSDYVNHITCEEDLFDYHVYSVYSICVVRVSRRYSRWWSARTNTHISENIACHLHILLGIGFVFRVCVCMWCSTKIVGWLGGLQKAAAWKQCGRV